VTARAR